jgi:hypothetical protein
VGELDDVVNVHLMRFHGCQRVIDG